MKWPSRAGAREKHKVVLRGLVHQPRLVDIEKTAGAQLFKTLYAYWILYHR